MNLATRIPLQPQSPALARVWPRTPSSEASIRARASVQRPVPVKTVARYGDVDYHPTALAHYRAWLTERYRSVAALNARYGTAHRSFDDVAPPTSAPGTSASERPRNPWYHDWYEAGQALCADYLRRLRTMIEAEGFREPDVLISANDSPFTISVADFVARTVLLQDGLSKSRVAHHAIDLYPRVAPLLFALRDDPFQADWFTRL